MQLPEPCGRNFFLKPKCMDLSVDHKANFCLIFLLYFNNTFQKMQGTSLLVNVFPLHLSRTKDC